MTEFNDLKTPSDTIFDNLCTRDSQTAPDACVSVSVSREGLAEALKSDPLRQLLGFDIDEWLTIDRNRTLDDLIKKLAFGRFKLKPAFDYQQEFYD